jgi:hypothetical protein
MTTIIRSSGKAYSRVRAAASSGRQSGTLCVTDS